MPAPMRALILGHALDPSANAVAAALHQRGGWQIHRHDLTTLVGARWEQRLLADGTLTTRVEIERADVGSCDVVFNRIGPLLALALPGWSTVDRSYGQAEWLALVISWLASLGGRVIGAPCGSSLAGPPDRLWMWMAAAAMVGLPPHFAGATSSVRQFPPSQIAEERPELMPVMGETTMLLDRPLGHAAPAAALCDLIIVGDAVFGDIDPGPAVRAACVALAGSRNSPVMALRLAQSAGDPCWRFVAANAMPVIDGGAPLAALIDLMMARAA